jgi:outer membrane receptor protein involved in Fe transport
MRFFNQHFSLALTDKKLPEIELGVDYSLLSSKTDNGHFTYDEYKPYLSINTEYRGLTLETEYKIHFINSHSLANDQTRKFFDISLYYRKPDKPWGFEISLKNVLNQQYKINYNYLPYISRIQTTYLQPRIILFKIHYKL